MDELNKVLPSEEVTSEAIEDTLAMLSEMGVNVVEAEEDAAEGTRGRGPRGDRRRRDRDKQSAFDRTDDPVRMYLREMGSVELLSREGEIAIAKRIEAGRDTMIRGLCESALTFEAIMVWREELAGGRILLREVIDLEQTYGGQVGPGPVRRGRGRRGRTTPPPRSPARTRTRTKAPRLAAAQADEDDFDDGAGPTISAMEGELREGVMATLDAIAAEFEAFRRLQEKLVVAPAARARTSATPTARPTRPPTATIVQHLKTLKLNNNRIEALVEQLYAINKRLMGLEGRLLRLADSYGISRTEFLKAYFGSELDPAWRQKVAALGVRWTKFAENDAGQIGDIRQRDRRPGHRDPACRSTTTAASSRPCRRASARPARPRRKWSRPTCAW